MTCEIGSTLDEVEGDVGVRQTRPVLSARVVRVGAEGRRRKVPVRQPMKRPRPAPDRGWIRWPAKIALRSASENVAQVPVRASSSRRGEGWPSAARKVSSPRRSRSAPKQRHERVRPNNAWLSMLPAAPRLPAIVRLVSFQIDAGDRPARSNSGLGGSVGRARRQALGRARWSSSHADFRKAHQQRREHRNAVRGHLQAGPVRHAPGHSPTPRRSGGSSSHFRFVPGMVRSRW